MSIRGAQRRRAAAFGVALLCAGTLLGCAGAEAESEGGATASPTSASTSAPAPTTSAPAPTPTATPSSDANADADTAAPAPAIPPPPQSNADAPVAVTDVIDGDTIDTTVGRIRVIGIDTPERGECNFGPATSLLRRLIAESGNQVVLTAASDKDDEDRYGRLLRYIDSPSGVDFGRELIAAGYAIARYDSRDGYGAHPREADYVALDAAVAQIPCPGGSSG